jgi:hypothetical protein
MGRDLAGVGIGFAVPLADEVGPHQFAGLWILVRYEAMLQAFFA